jgi:F-box/WD-40 domain protein MET30
MVNSVSLWDGRTSPADRAFNSIVDSPVSATPPMQSAAKFLFSASDDGTIKMWDLASKSCLRTYAGHTGQIQSIRVLVVDKEVQADESDEDAVRSGGRRGRSVSHMDDHTGDIASTNSASGPISCSATFAPFQPGNSRASRDQVPIDLTADLPADKQALLVSGALDNTIKVWDVETGLEKSTLFGHIEGVWAVDVDSLRMASASHGQSRPNTQIICSSADPCISHRSDHQDLGPRIRSMRSDPCRSSRR